MERNTLLTDNLVRRFTAAIGRGASYSKACEFVGISRGTFYNWMARAEQEGGEFLEFKKAVEKANAKLYIDLVNVIRTAALDDNDVKAAETLLKGRFSKDFGPPNQTVQHDISGTVDINVAMEQRLATFISTLREDQLDAIVTELVSRGANPPQQIASQGSSTQEADAIYEADFSRLHHDEAQPDDSGEAGSGGGREDTQAYHRDASPPRQEPAV